MYPITQSHFEKENTFVFVSLLGKVEKLKIPTDISLKVFSIGSQYVLVIYFLLNFYIRIKDITQGFIHVNM